MSDTTDIALCTKNLTIKKKQTKQPSGHFHAVGKDKQMKYGGVIS